MSDEAASLQEELWQSQAEFEKAVERTDYWIDKYDELLKITLLHARWCTHGSRLEKDADAILVENQVAQMALERLQKDNIIEIAKGA